MSLLKAEQTGYKGFILWAVLILLVVGVLISAWLALSNAVVESMKIYKVLSYPGNWRGVRFAVNEEFASYLDFLRLTVPEDGILGLPPSEHTTWALSSTPFMRFFLAPRQVVNCTSAYPSCAQNLLAQNASLVVLGNQKFPPQGTDAGSGSVAMFNEKWGVMIPSGERLSEKTGPDLISPWDTFWQVLLTFTSLAALTVAGFCLLHAWLPQLPSGTKIALGFGLGVGWLTFSVYLFLLFESIFSGDRINITWWVLAATVSWLVFCAVVAWKKREFLHKPGSDLSITTLSWYVLLISLAVVAAVIAVGKGYSTSDEFFIWGAKGYGIAYDGLVAGTSEWGTHTASYPLQIPLWIASVKAATGDEVAQAKLLFPAFYAGILLLVFDLLRQRGRHLYAGLATLGLGLSPFIFRQSSLSYANLPLAFELTCAVILVLYAVRLRDKVNEVERKYLFLAGVFLGLGAWTRPEGIFLSLVVAAVTLLGLALWWGSRSMLARSMSVFVIPLICIELLWLVFSFFDGGKPASMLSEVLPAVGAISSGNLHFSEAGYIFRYALEQLVDFPVWGTVGIGLIIFLILAIFIRKPGRSVLYLLSCSIGCAGVILAMYYLLSFGKEHDISWWVSTGLNRMLLPAVVLAWVGVCLWLFSSEGKVLRFESNGDHA